METLQIEWRNENQKSIILNLLEELQVTYRTVYSENEDNELYGEGCKQSVLEINRAYEEGETSQFLEMEIKDLWK